MCLPHFAVIKFHKPSLPCFQRSTLTGRGWSFKFMQPAQLYSLQKRSANVLKQVDWKLTGIPAGAKPEGWCKFIRTSMGSWCLEQSQLVSHVFSFLVAGWLNVHCVICGFGSSLHYPSTATTPPDIPNFISTRGPSVGLNFRRPALLAHVSTVVRAFQRESDPLCETFARH